MVVGLLPENERFLVRPFAIWLLFEDISSSRRGVLSYNCGIWLQSNCLLSFLSGRCLCPDYLLVHLGEALHLSL